MTFYVEVKNQAIGFYDDVLTAVERAKEFTQAKVFREDEVLIMDYKDAPGSMMWVLSWTN